MASWPSGGLLYAEAADPFGQKTGEFVVLDAVTGDTVFSDGSPEHLGYRSIAVDADGGAWITWNDTSLARYDPATNTLEPTEVTLPGTTLRAATRPASDGTIYAVTDEPPVFFALEPDGVVRELGPARHYTTSLALSADETRFFSVPGAHSGLVEAGTPLVAVDTVTGAEEVLVELYPLVERGLGVEPGRHLRRRGFGRRHALHRDQCRPARVRGRLWRDRAADRHAAVTRRRRLILPLATAVAMAFPAGCSSDVTTRTGLSGTSA